MPFLCLKKQISSCSFLSTKILSCCGNEVFCSCCFGCSSFCSFSFCFIVVSMGQVWWQHLLCLLMSSGALPCCVIDFSCSFFPFCNLYFPSLSFLWTCFFSALLTPIFCCRSVEICLDEVSKCNFFIGLLGERYGWQSSKHSVPDEERFDWVRDYPSGRSITELEMEHACLAAPDQVTGRAFFYIRDSSFLPWVLAFFFVKVILCQSGTITQCVPPNRDSCIVLR